MDKAAWASMTPDERRAYRIARWCRPDVAFVNADAEASYASRVARLVAALSLQRPDCVPVNIQAGFLPGTRAGLTPGEALRDPARVAAAWRQFTLDFEPDAFVDPGAYAVSASALELLDYRLYSWPGHGIPDDAGYQFNERDWMLPEEYDHLISDPSDYVLRVYLPRAVGAFAGFGGLSSFFDYSELPFVSGSVGAWGTPEMLDGLARIGKAAALLRASQAVLAPVPDAMVALGFPPLWGGTAKAPFDILGDTLRGTKGVILDLFRRPDKVLAACERLVQVALDWCLKRAGLPLSPVVFMPLHKGADGFMSDEQFRTFYWPTLRKVIDGLIEEGLIPCLFAEGRYVSRLEIIQDVPKAKTVWLFDQTDMAIAKKTVGQVACIQGNVPLSLLHAGTPERVTGYCRQLIELAGEGGGFILDIGAKADDAKDENLRAMVETAKHYGVYS
jgi:hypothetical protein